MKNLTLSACMAAAAFTMAAPASAHSTLEVGEAPAGSTYRAVLRVPHGCDGQATHTVSVDLPEGFYNAKPMPKADWMLETETGTYETPYMNHGTEMTEGVRTITWSDGNLEDGWYDEFVFRGSIGADIEPGTVLYFPTTQICADGTADWTDTSGESGVPNPAPSLTVVAAGGGDDHGHSHNHGAHGDVASADVTIGELTLSGAFTRASLPNQPVGGGYVTITNPGDTDDTLIAGSAPFAGRVEIHEMAMEGDVMRMRELADGLPIPAGETVVLEPGGYHVMFMELGAPLVEGENHEVTLEFENAGEVTLTFPVAARNAEGMDHGAMDHGAMDHSGGEN
ncbi:DUF1775 domain-containing protein [Pelagovum pacificum]|uniref:DUF1775 domain-containing protein n=1 Tax=Pelagovum pacificum TaxID=2588711 RepID=A0A5C5GEY6_9RHOB|nr:DUF1775 domain-containing protein [Pelagovum pacificum]QQA44261.1 DUF1775 domain-containing protein [Pelagovum pacificum]TNY32617.1 DUF1775 domain-containing protein [Pelagovum pacificum]